MNQANNKDIFDKPIFNLPLKREGKDVYIFLDSIYSNYLKTIKKFKGKINDSLNQHYNTIQNECDSILESLKLYLEGQPSKSYIELERCLNVLNFSGLLEIQQTNKSQESCELYRIRIAANANMRREDLFHIPFDLRERVSTQRYSIPGLPCLYLADSVFVCWEELGRPDFNSVHVSKFDISVGKFKLLYLNVSTNEMRKRCFHNSNDGKLTNQLVKYLCYWPLLAACSLIVDKPREVFKPEYIIPQLVLQWIVSAENLDGVQYKSNMVRMSSHNIGTFTNIAIPVKEIKDSGYCSKLIRNVKLTSPISWQLLEISEPQKAFISNKKEDIDISSLRRASYIEMIEGEKTPYLESKFGVLEEKLRAMPVKCIIA